MKQLFILILLIHTVRCYGPPSSGQDAVRDPIRFTITNRTSEVIYLETDNYNSILDRAMIISRKSDNQQLHTQLDCTQNRCQDGCRIVHCESQHQVIALMPKEPLLIEWSSYYFEESSLLCDGHSTACYEAILSQDGRYLANLCFGTAITSADPSQPISKHAFFPNTLSNAKLSEKKCRPELFDFIIPNFNVRFEIPISEF